MTADHLKTLMTDALDRLARAVTAMRRWLSSRLQATVWQPEI